MDGRGYGEPEAKALQSSQGMEDIKQEVASRREKVYWGDHEWCGCATLA